MAVGHWDVSTVRGRRTASNHLKLISFLSPASYILATYVGKSNHARPRKRASTFVRSGRMVFLILTAQVPLTEVLQLFAGDGDDDETYGAEL